MGLAVWIWLTAGIVLVYMAAVDENVVTWLVLLSKSAGIWVRQRWFLIRYDPDSPWVRWSADRSSRRIADELLKEQQNK